MNLLTIAEHDSNAIAAMLELATTTEKPLAGKGVAPALRGNPALAKGLNVCQGRIVHPGVAESVNEKASPLESVLG